MTYLAAAGCADAITWPEVLVLLIALAFVAFVVWLVLG